MLIPRLRRLAWALCLAPLSSPVAAAEDGETATVLDTLPPPVAAATWCAEDGPGFATRRVFAGRVIFAVACPGNNANFIQALVAADDEDGTNARALVFPTPYPADPDDPNDTIANIRWLPGNAVSGIFVDPEEIDGPCRHEARWRLEGTGPTAVLVAWRETHDCEGNSGWSVVVEAGQ
jgi:hypothetical protein